MACVTLKRSLEHDPASVVSSTKRRRFHHCGSRSPSSPTCSTSSMSMSHLAGSSSSACGGALTFVPPPAAPSAESEAASDFPASRLPPELLSQRLTAEVRRLQRRRLIPSASAPTIGGSCGSGSDTEMPAASLCTHCGAAAVKAAAAGCSTTLSPSSSSSTQSEPALFTLSQVQSIAEKLLSEREQQIRSEFQALLSAKLQEQYDAFLRFNHDQIYRMHSGAPMSYVS